MPISARLDELQKRFDENPRRYFAPLANEYRKLGDLVQAISLCRAHLPHQPGHISGNIVLAQALFESGELVEARRSFEAALEMDPENLIALRHLGDIAKQEGATEAARAWYQRVLDADPRNDEIAQVIEDLSSNGAAAPALDLAAPADAPVAPATVPPEVVAAPRVPVLVPPAYHPDTEPAHSPPAVEAAAEPGPASPTPPAGPVPELSAAAAEPPRVEPPPIAAQADDWFRPEPPQARHEPISAAETFLPEFGEVPAPPQPPEPRLDDFLSEWEAAHAPDAHAAPPGTSLPITTPDAGAGDFPVLDWVDAGSAGPSSQPREPEASQDAPPEPEPVAADAGSDDQAPSWPSFTAVDAGDAVYWDAEPVSTRSRTPWDALVVPGPPEPPAPPPSNFDLGFAVVGEGHPAPPSDPLIGRTPEFTQPVGEQPPAPFITETMAELYLQQGFNEEALAIYRQLLAQSPGDLSLQRRVAVLEGGGGSAVVGPDLEVSATPEPVVTVRAFFAGFATRARRDRGVPVAATPNAAEATAERAAPALGGAATRDEALTRPDDGQASLVGLFSEAETSSEDARAATSLASAFDIVAPEGERPGELSLGHLFRDVEAHSADAVTAGEPAPDPMPASPDEGASGDVESHADIEQFTAWLEGLKKK